MPAESSSPRAGKSPTLTGASLKAGGLLGAFVTGMFVVVQARINGELGHEIGDGLLAAWISFVIGLIVLLVLVTALPPGRRGLRRVRAARRAGRLAPWNFLGGVGGALLVASQGLTTAALGTALFTIAVVAGQSSGGLVVDRVGLGPAGPQATTLPRVVGAVVMLAAVALSVGPSLIRSFTSTSDGSVPVALAVLPLAAGLALAAQQALNGRVAAVAGRTGSGAGADGAGAGGAGAGGAGAGGAGADGAGAGSAGPDGAGADSPRAGGADADAGGGDAPGAAGSGEPDHWLASVLPAATINFAVGTAVLTVAAAIGIAVLGWPPALPSAPWLYLGGVCGATFIALGAWVVGRIGVLLLSLGAVAGQVVVAVVLDAVVPAAAGRPGLITIVGALLTLVAAGIASLPTRGRRPAG